MSGSLFVPAELSDVNNVLVDIGTGYYVKKVQIIFFVHVVFMLLNIAHLLCINTQCSQ
jgi:hypothetical protein